MIVRQRNISQHKAGQWNMVCGGWQDEAASPRVLCPRLTETSDQQPASGDNFQPSPASLAPASGIITLLLPDQARQLLLVQILQLSFRTDAIMCWRNYTCSLRPGQLVKASIVVIVANLVYTITVYTSSLYHCCDQFIPDCCSTQIA